MFKTEFILANVAFFVKVISRKKNAAATAARGTGPRDLSQNEKRPQLKRPRTFTLKTKARRGTGPRPTVKGDVLSPVARGPVPRDLSAETRNVRSPEAMDVCCHDRCMARDRPSPYGEGALFLS